MSFCKILCQKPNNKWIYWVESLLISVFLHEFYVALWLRVDFVLSMDTMWQLNIEKYILITYSTVSLLFIPHHYYYYYYLFHPIIIIYNNNNISNNVNYINKEHKTLQFLIKNLFFFFCLFHIQIVDVAFIGMY